MENTVKENSEKLEAFDSRKEPNCIHCGERLTESQVDFCCMGCSTVYELIHNMGLGDYYRIRKYDDFATSPLKPTDKPGEKFEYLNLPEFTAIYTEKDSGRTMKFYIEGIHCSACLWIIEKVPDFAPEVESVSLNMAENVATVTYRDDSHFNIFPEFVTKFGYKPHPLISESDAESYIKKEKRESIYRIGVAAVCTGNIMLLSASIYAGATGIFAKSFEYIIFLLSLPVITYCAYPFYKSVLRALKLGRSTVDIPIAFVVLAGFGLSTINLATGGEIYFDSVTAFIFLLLSSRYLLRLLQDGVRKNELAENIFLGIGKVLKWSAQSKQFFLSPIITLEAGDRIKLGKGERVPVDGRLFSPKATLNLSVLTGESKPRTVLKGGDVFAGSYLENEAVLDVLKTGENTRIGGILRNIEKRALSKTNFSNFSDKYSTLFTLFVAVISIVFFGIYSVFFNVSEGLERTISFILISCPCAFVFALPLTYAFSTKYGAAKGFIVKDINVFDKLTALKKVYFDKTGTLTKGNFKILSWNTKNISPYDRAAIRAIEQKSGHPVADAIVSYLVDDEVDIQVVDEYEHLHSIGFRGRIGKDVYEFVTSKTATDDNDFRQIILTKVDIYKNKNLISRVILGDELREDAKYVNDCLQKMGIRTFILSGDNKQNVLQVAEILEMPNGRVYGELHPEDKISILAKESGTMMVGDGLNDSGALSEADIGVAIHGGVEESMNASDIYLINNKLLTIIELLKHGKATSGIIKTSVVFSILYNAGAGILAMMGFINPLAAAVLMPISSVVLAGIGYIGSMKLRLVNY